MDDNLVAADKRHVWHPFTPMRAWCDEAHEPLVIVSGHGCTLTDQHGCHYLDGNSSIWTNIHGHGHPAINRAIIDQLGRVAHTSFLGFTHEPAIRLAEALVQLVPGNKLPRVFYSDNGSTAIEAAARMALQFWRQQGRMERDTILAFDHAYHGDTLGAASMGGLPLFKGSANHFGYRVQRVPSVSALANVDASSLAAVLIEPLVQGAAGMRTWPAGMLRELRAWCDKHDVLLICDEVMTGFGRTGKMFASEHEGVVPDIMAVAKGITGGYLPLAATLASERIFASFLPPENTFYYGHSYTANPLGCAAALASLQVFEDEQVLEQLPEKMRTFDCALDRLRGHQRVGEVRQCGLIAGIDVISNEAVGARICIAAREHGLLTRPILNTLILMPPLCVTAHEMERMVDALFEGIVAVLGT